MKLHTAIVPCALALVTGVGAAAAWTGAEEKPKAPASVDLSGRWLYNKELSDDARAKMREAREGREGGGPGGGGRGPGGGMGGPGGGGGMGGRGGGMGGPGGGMGPPPGMASDDDAREAMRSLLEPAEELTITATAAEIVVQEQFGSTRNLHPNGKPYKTDNGTAEIKTHWKDGKLVVEKKSARGGKLVETWELIPDRSRILLNVKMEGGFGPALALKRVYDRAKEGAAP